MVKKNTLEKVLNNIHFFTSWKIDAIRELAEYIIDGLEKEEKKKMIDWPLVFRDTRMIELWAGFEEVRKKKRAPLSTQAIKMIFRKLEGKTVNEAIAMFENAIEKGYTTIYPINKEHNFEKKNNATEEKTFDGTF